jgi:sporulation protein YlmC with PRC-barrel domain
MSLRRYGKGRERTPNYRFQDLRGLQVYDLHNRRLGKVSAVFVDTESNETIYAEVSPGGILGLGRQRRVVPCEKLRHLPQGLCLTDTR